MKEELGWLTMHGTLSKNQEAANKQLGQDYILNTTTQCKQKLLQPHPAHPPGIEIGGLNPRLHHRGATANGGNESGEHALLCGRGVTLRIIIGRG